MAANSMDVFALRDTIVREYEQFATSFTTIYAEDLREQIEKIYATDRFWPEPLIQINPSYKRSTNVAALADAGELDARCAEIFRADDEPLALYTHQQEAIALAKLGESYVVTTGTGSGKSLSFFIPIVNAVLADKRAGGGKRTRAIVIYPMNALANSQLEELGKFIGNVAGDKPVTFARYTGQENDEQRRAIADDPPDILLTNFMMLELLMTRQEAVDRKVIGNCAGLRFLVLDELHTYRGRQGADVALLVRRVRERLSNNLVCIGTSATMTSDGSVDDKRSVVARVASTLFSTEIPPSSVIVETLERVTNPAKRAETVRAALGAAIDAGIAPTISDAELRENALAIWVETRLGVRWSDVDHGWIRARPRTVTEAVDELVADSGRDGAACRRALRELLLTSSVHERERTGRADANPQSFFAFKLHQFISGAGHAFATLEPAGKRRVTIDAQQFLPGDEQKRLYAVHFCRECGHEYHPVRLVDDNGEKRLLARDIDDSVPAGEDDTADTQPDDQKEILGFLTPHARDDDFRFDNKDDDFPETWLDYDASGNAKLKPTYRAARPQEMSVAADGKVGSGTRAWFLPGKFRLCLRCKTTQGGSARDRNRLASLSAEGRSSATTVLVSSALRWMHSDASGMPKRTRKLLGFTDNRQDAALQAGHFNDFIFVTLLRAGFLGALDAAGDRGLRSEELGAAQQKALGFDRPIADLRAEWLVEPDTRGFHLQEAEATLRQVLAYRVWFDQRRGWRYTNPNLENLKLLEVDYLGVDDLAADESLFAGAPAPLRDASPAVRANVYRELFDHLRKWMAVRSHVLDATVVEQMLSKSHGRIRPPWGFGNDERPRRARWLMITTPSRKAITLRDEDLIVRGGSRSALGKILKTSRTREGRTLWSDLRAVRDLKAPEFDQLVEALLKAAVKHGLVAEEVTPFGDAVGWRLNDGCVVFKRGTPSADARPENKFFCELYANLARLLASPSHPLFGFEAREHTAQVDQENRKYREKRFRYGNAEEKELHEQAKQLREIGESDRFLPVMFCSPTMELGVDISALNTVYLRNVPPTPANYAQRSGRAGRSGQAALVLTYCSAQGPHDQYFFRDPRAMVHGEVRPPLLDLANRDLVESHLHAVWLACTEEPLAASISELLVLDDPARPLQPEVRTPMIAPRVTEEAVGRIKRVLDLLEGDLTQRDAPWFVGRDEFAASVAQSAITRFERAFQRWRDLFEAAEQQRDAARKTMDHYSAPIREKRAAETRHAQALAQLNLLQDSSSTTTSDFYTYRYLATEGFLPGYNFPRLPLMAYVPATTDGRGRHTYLQRPRFLALAEFGPRSLVYHEGRAYRVERALLALGHRDAATAETQLPTRTVRICRQCGAGHFGDDASICHACHVPLSDAEVIKHIYRIENVATRPVERITANDEERQRQGFELQTTFRWAERDHVLDVRRGAAADDAGDILRLAYGAGATITRLNKGLRRRANRTELGFKIDPVSGYWQKNKDEEGEATDPTASPRQWIVPSVEDHKNALLVRPATDDLSERTVATFQHAFLRGIETAFQLEEGEIIAEPMPLRDARRGFLLYEATEGGAGVLTRLVAEPDRVAQVAREALRIMHFDIAGGLPREPDGLRDAENTSCVAACYRCLMSYFNQPDHDLLDRRDHDARALLLRLANARTLLVDEPTRRSTRPPSDDPLLTKWHAVARSRELPQPDDQPFIESVPLVWRSHYVAAAFDDVPEDARTTLDDKGIELVVFGQDDAAWTTPFERLSKALGRSA